MKRYIGWFAAYAVVMTGLKMAMSRIENVAAMRQDEIDSMLLNEQVSVQYNAQDIKLSVEEGNELLEVTDYWEWSVPQKYWTPKENPHPVDSPEWHSWNRKQDLTSF